MPKLECLIIERVAGKVDIWEPITGEHIAASRTDREDALTRTCFEQDKQIALLKDSHKEMSKQLEDTRNNRDRTYRELEKAMADVCGLNDLIDEHIAREKLSKDWRVALSDAKDRIMTHTGI